MPFPPLLPGFVRTNPLVSTWLGLRALARDSHLRQVGWFRSRAVGLPVDAAGAPLPWYTYGAIRFLEGRLRPPLRVFEYGSGHSTLWWAARVARVVSCEHDAMWHGRMQPLLPATVAYHHVSLAAPGEYAGFIGRFRSEFEVVVLDGRERVACARNAVPALAPGGVIVWDNSDRDAYGEGFDLLRRAGFRRLDFWGMGPINAYGWCTTVFYRPENVLGI